MNTSTNDLTLEELISLLENNFQYGRTTGENEVKRLISRIRELERGLADMALVLLAKD